MEPVQKQSIQEESYEGRKREEQKAPMLTYLPMPERQADNVSVQLGLFEQGDAALVNRALDYVRGADTEVVERDTASIYALVRTIDKPEHECVVVVTAKAKEFNESVFKAYANIEPLTVSANWMAEEMMAREMVGIGRHLDGFDHRYSFEGHKGLLLLMAMAMPKQHQKQVMQKTKERLRQKRNR